MGPCVTSIPPQFLLPPSFFSPLLAPSFLLSFRFTLSPSSLPLCPSLPLPPSLLSPPTPHFKVFGHKVRVDSTAKVAELELAEKVSPPIAYTV